MAATVLRGLSRFADGRGIPASAECLLGYDVIEALCVAGLRGRASCTRGTYRSALYRLAVPVHGEPGMRATPFAGAAAPAPYSPAERAELAAIAAAQRGPAKRASALAMVVFGIGAGLRPGELAALRGSDVRRHGGQVTVHVAGSRHRLVPVASRYAGRAADLARGAGGGFVFRPGPASRGYKNFVTNFARGLAADPAAPRLSMGRCRSSFICDHLAAGTPAGELLAVTGICQAESLARYARHVDGAPAKAALRAWDNHRRAR
jgi:integrase